MSALATSIIAFACIFGGALFGVLLRNRVLGSHLDSDTKDVIRLGTGLVGTMAALVLGLMISSASASYNSQDTRLQEMTAKIILLDNVLAQYGPETKGARVLLRRAVALLADRLWGADTTETRSSFVVSEPADQAAKSLFQLAPATAAQTALKDQAVHLLTDVGQTRLLLFAEQRDSGLPIPFLVVLIFWLTIIFMSFSLFSRLNLVAGISLVVFAVSAAGAIYLILEFSQPFTGLVKISDVALRNALAPLSP